MRVRLEVHDGYLRVEVAGTFDADAARRGIGQMFEACAARQLNRVLVDARGLEQDIGIAERFELALDLAQRHAGQVRIAILADPVRMTTKALEDSACNRGVPVRTTTDVGEAYGFLGIEPPG